MQSKSIALMIVLVALARPAGAQQADALAALLERTAPSIVTVQVVIKTEVMMMGQAQNEETRTDLQGVVVDGSGLVMISNAEISADRMKDALSGIPSAAMMDFKVTPTGFKVVFGNEQEEHPAFLVAKDTKLDLAFVQVEDLGDRELVPVGFAGPLSLLAPPNFLIGPQDGYVWSRFTVTNIPLGTNDWDGTGQFEDGESEDYLLLVLGDTPTERSTWGAIKANYR